ncbi:MAG: hypothetical protein L3J78_01245 [Thermoplasmata archaeon]|nr:hypothetical protein [Thermoplasmata archaeon]
MRRNSEAAILAAIAGACLLLSGWTGARPVDRFFALLNEAFGPQPALIVLAYVFVGLASFGGLAVLLGGYLIWKDRVRTGRILVLLGSGAGIFTLLLFVLVNLRREEFSLLASVLPIIVGIATGIAARFWARATPILS